MKLLSECVGSFKICSILLRNDSCAFNLMTKVKNGLDKFFFERDVTIKL